MGVKLELNPIEEILTKRGLEERGKAQQLVDSEVLRLCEPYVPRDTGALISSGHSNTVIGSGEVKYSTPYARRWYYEPAEFEGAPKRGNYWFERMKKEGGIMDILQKLALSIGGHI